MSDCKNKYIEEHNNCNHNCHDNCKEKCHNNCKHNCKSTNQDTVFCPICHSLSIKVPLETVKAISKIEEIEGDFNLCTSRTCKVTYFNETYLFEKEDIDTKIWFKEELKDFIVCYCKDITLDDIINAVKKTKTTNKDEILKYLNKTLDNNDCLHKNPVGKSCEKLFANAIEYASKIK